MIAEEAEVGRRKCNSPRRIQPGTAIQPLQKFPSRRELVDKSKAWEVEIIMLCGVLLGVGHIKASVDLLHIEGSESRRNFAIFKRRLIIVGGEIYWTEVCVINLHSP